MNGVRLKRVLTGLTALFAVALLAVVTATTAFATKPPEHKVTICHATPPDTAAQGWHSITVDVASVGYQHSGHQDQHDADIIPAWSYTDADGNTVSYAGKNLGDLGAFGFPGVNGADVLEAGCVVPEQPPGGPIVVSPIPPTVTTANCDDPQVAVVKFDTPGVNGQPTGVHVDVQGELTGPSHVVITFSPEEGYAFPEGTQTVYTYDLSGPLTGVQCRGEPPGGGDNPKPPKKCAKNDAQCQAAKLPDGVSDQQLIEDSGSRVQGG